MSLFKHSKWFTPSLKLAIEAAEFNTLPNIAGHGTDKLNTIPSV
jgi:hypothetical protein